MFVNFRVERDAQLLANRIALLKQEEMKTWKKIEETKKRTNELHGLKKRNEEKVQKVFLSNLANECFFLENCRLADQHRESKDEFTD